MILGEFGDRNRMQKSDCNSFSKIKRVKNKKIK